MNIIDPQIEKFIRRVLPNRNPQLQEMERQAKERKIPIVPVETAMFLYLLVKSHHAKEVLEVGTAIGYSTYWLSEAVKENHGRITAVELSPGNAEEAQENWAALGCSEAIQLIMGNALKVLPTLVGPYDCIFLDANKSQYPDLFPYCYNLLKPGGIWITDNILFHGQVVESQEESRPLVVKLKKYIDLLTTHPGLETVLLPVGDGVALSYKRGEGIE